MKRAPLRLLVPALALIALGCGGLPALFQKKDGAPEASATPAPAPAPLPEPGPRGPNPVVYTLDVGPYSTEDDRVTIWLAQRAASPDDAPVPDRNFGPMAALSVESWVFADDGRAVLAVTKDDKVIALDIAAGTSRVLPTLPDRASVGFLADNSIVGVAYTSIGQCDGSVKACHLVNEAWRCEASTPLGGWNDPGCDPPAWAGEPAFADVVRGPEVSQCGALPPEAAPTAAIAAAFPFPAANWVFNTPDTPWAYQRGEGSCGAAAEYPIFVWNGKAWTALQLATPVQVGSELRFEQTGPWLLIYGPADSALYDLASATPDKSVALLPSGTLWPAEIPVPGLGGSGTPSASANAPASSAAPSTTTATNASPATATSTTTGSGRSSTPSASTKSTNTAATTTAATTTAAPAAAATAPAAAPSPRDRHAAAEPVETVEEESETTTRQSSGGLPLRRGSRPKKDPTEDDRH